MTFSSRSPRPRPRVVLFVTIVAAALALACVADAATVVLEKHEPFTDAFTNPCTGELIMAAGFMHLKLTFDELRSRIVLTGLEVNFQNTKGVTVDGVTYIVPASSSVHLVEDGSDGIPMNVTAEETHQFIRQHADGSLLPDDDFLQHSLIHMTINAEGELTVGRFESRAECR
jgi:hypothetical protein